MNFKRPSLKGNLIKQSENVSFKTSIHSDPLTCSFANLLCWMIEEGKRHVRNQTQNDSSEWGTFIRCLS